jgi:AcrR family transcriptional regulator
MPPSDPEPEVIDADSAMVEGKAPPSERVPLDRDRILEAAVAFVDENGLRGLTMRRLGSELGVEAMSLYRYVAGREELLDGIVEKVLAEMAEDSEIRDAPTDGWQDFLQRLAHGFRRVALAHPGVFPLLAARPPEAPWIRPPLRDLQWVERFLNGLLGAGFSDETAVGAYRAFTSFLLGHLLLEVSTKGADVGPLDILDPGTDPSPGLDDYPHVERLSKALGEDHSATEFEESLENLLDRLQLLLAEDAEDNAD